MIDEISEEAATGSIARCYAEIRQRLGVPIVNLIWRRLAAIGAIDECWQKVRAELPTITHQAAVLNASARAMISSLPPAIPLPRSETAARILVSYERGNSLNLATIRRLLNAPPVSGSGALPHAPDQLPPIPHYGTLNVDLRSAIEGLSTAGPAGDTGIRPTLWVHLASVPDVIRAAATTRIPILACASFRQAHALLTAPTEHSAGGVVSSEVLALLQAFNRRISEMLLIGLHIAHAPPISAETRP